jgi:hypothetical protein
MTTEPEFTLRAQQSRQCVLAALEQANSGSRPCADAPASHACRIDDPRQETRDA